MNKTALNDYFNSLEEDLIGFAQALIRIKSPTGREGELAQVIRTKMELLGYDKVFIDKLGNVIGIIGEGTPSLLFDSHMDTVLVDDHAEWSFDPFGGKIINGDICGRGAVDMKCGLAASVYAGAAAKELALTAGKTIAVSCSVMEEDYDGEAFYSICKDKRFHPDNVVICEPSNLKMALGHRGRALIKIETNGVAAHGSAPEKGINAIYKMRPIIARVEELNDAFIRNKNKKGSVTLSIIESTAVSANAVPTKCRIFLDRRLALNEDWDYIKNEMDKLLGDSDAVWEICQIEGKSWTNEAVLLNSFLPAWELESHHPLAKEGSQAYRLVFEDSPEEYYWNFCTNGVASAGRLGIPTIGLGPGDPNLAHKRDERCPVREIRKAAEFYTVLSSIIHRNQPQRQKNSGNSKHNRRLCNSKKLF